MNWKNLFPKENRYFETENGILYYAEAIETMNKFPKDFFDAIITDPPYGTTACKWDDVIPFENMWNELKRIRKDRTPIILFGSEPFSSMLRISNIKEYKYDWVWIKEQGTGFLNANKQPLRSNEQIIIFYKKQSIYNPQMRKGFKPYKTKKGGLTENYRKDSVDEIITINKGERYPLNTLFFKRDKFKLHPTQKPLDLMEYLIKTYSNKNDLILDFTCGSGTTLVAAEKLNRRWIGIELEEKYCKIAKQRLEEVIK